MSGRIGKIGISGGIGIILLASLIPATVLADEPPAPAPPPAPEKVLSVTYACQSGATIVARYDNSNADAPTATLDYQGKSFPMYSVRSASGARYATEQGLSPDKGLQWWTKGSSATLSEMIMDHTAPEPTAIEECTAKPGP